MTLPTMDRTGASRLDAPTRPVSAGEGPGAYPPIGDYALLSDCHSAALVSRDGSIDWCCFHRFDARPVSSRTTTSGWSTVAPTRWCCSQSCLWCGPTCAAAAPRPCWVPAIRSSSPSPTSCLTSSMSTGSAATRWPPASTAPSGSGGTGRPAAPTRVPTGSRCCAAPWSSRASPTPPPAPSSPPPPPPCPRRSAGRATGTTASAGCATPP